jgi:hypothetical protein
MIYGESFNGLFDAVERIEQHIGLRYYTDSETINGRLNNIESLSSDGMVRPYCQIDVPISGDSFEVLYEPILIGDSWAVNNSVVITVSEDGDEKEVDEWGDIEFQGKYGTLMGANGKYHGKLLTITYFYNQTMLYYDIVFSGGYPETKKAGTSFFDLVITDDLTGENQRIFIDSKGRVSSYLVTDTNVGDNTFADEVNGQTYELYSENGHINWRVI